MSSPLEILLEMGFPKSRAEKALVITGNQGAEAAMEWLLVHGEDSSVDDPLESNIVDKVAESGVSDDSPKCEKEVVNDDVKLPDDVLGTQLQVKSIKCDECQKLFKSEAEVEFHAAKTGHSSFSESTEEVKPLTEAERAEQLKQLQEILRNRRIKKEEDEKQEAINKEKLRRRVGQEMLESRKKLEEEEIKRITQQRRMEKMEEKLARQRILEQIERDKQARKEKFGSPSSSTSISAPVENLPETSVPTSSKKTEYPETRLQIRLTNGQTLQQSFGSKEELAAVRLYIEMNRTDGSGPFTMMTTFPKRVFNEEDMEKPLYELGLSPSAVVILGKAVVA